MRVDILTLFPEMFPPVLAHSIVGRARKKGLLQVCCHQLRDFSPDARGRVDDTVFGGGKGMLLMAEPFARGIDRIREHLGNAWQKNRAFCCCAAITKGWTSGCWTNTVQRRSLWGIMSSPAGSCPL